LMKKNSSYKKRRSKNQQYYDFPHHETRMI
jgi:hypothetical protein